ncbi:MAG TPA: hypothetical protein P5230_01890 [Candidatus Magasanikbacteria bacterium]|nr:hypothetical protein [Candidatus Magasanikbacteria bacterium]
MNKKKNTEKNQDNLEKFAVFFEQQNSKAPAKKLMWVGVLIVAAGIFSFVVYATKLQINAFAWDKTTLEIKNTLENQWSESFDKKEKEQNLVEIKKQMGEIVSQIVSSTANANTNTNALISTTTVSTTTLLSTGTIQNTTTIKNKK